VADVRTKPEHFSQEEAAEIIRDATEVSLKGGHGALTREDLLTMAQELGVDAVSVERALETREQRKAQRKIRRGLLMALASHVSTYAVVIGGLTLLDIATGPGWWVQWPAIGWGIGVASHSLGTAVALLRRDELERRAEKYVARQARKAERDARRG
jgi:hypothetical protein